MKIHGKMGDNLISKKSKEENTSLLFAKCKLFIQFGDKIVSELEGKEKSPSGQSCSC